MSVSTSHDLAIGLQEKVRALAPDSYCTVRLRSPLNGSLLPCSQHCCSALLYWARSLLRTATGCPRPMTPAPAPALAPVCWPSAAVRYARAARVCLRAECVAVPAWEPQIEDLACVERAFVHVDFVPREISEHKAPKTPPARPPSFACVSSPHLARAAGRPECGAGANFSPGPPPAD